MAIFPCKIPQFNVKAQKVNNSFSHFFGKGDSHLMWGSVLPIASRIAHWCQDEKFLRRKMCCARTKMR